MKTPMQRTRYTSDELFHFVGYSHPDDHVANYDILRSVLADRCISHPPHERGWGVERLTLNRTESLVNGGLLVPDVVCFADIPREALGIHVKKYGMFGLSLARDHLVRYGARPVMYVPLHADDGLSIYGRTLLRDIEAVFRSLQDTTQDLPPIERRHLGRQLVSLQESAQVAYTVFGKAFLAFLKPFDADLENRDPENYYMEREWRRLGNVCFAPEQVGCILVPEVYVARLKGECPSFEQKVESIEANLANVLG